MKHTKKECHIEGSDITLKLEDLRDSYIHENALGQIGDIYISREGVMINANYDNDKKINLLRNKKLAEAFFEIFEATDYNPLSREYYDKILVMIKDGTLEFLGYEIKKLNPDLDADYYIENFSYYEQEAEYNFNKKRNRFK